MTPAKARIFVFMTSPVIRKFSITVYKPCGLKRAFIFEGLFVNKHEARSGRRSRPSHSRRRRPRRQRAADSHAAHILVRRPRAHRARGAHLAQRQLRHRRSRGALSYTRLGASSPFFGKKTTRASVGSCPSSAAAPRARHLASAAAAVPLPRTATAQFARGDPSRRPRGRGARRGSPSPALEEKKKKMERGRLLPPAGDSRGWFVPCVWFLPRRGSGRARKASGAWCEKILSSRSILSVEVVVLVRVACGGASRVSSPTSFSSGASPRLVNADE